jgi:hypothetical protein
MQSQDTDDLRSDTRSRAHCLLSHVLTQKLAPPPPPAQPPSWGVQALVAAMAGQPLSARQKAYATAMLTVGAAADGMLPSLAALEGALAAAAAAEEAVFARGAALQQATRALQTAAAQDDVPLSTLFEHTDVEGVGALTLPAVASLMRTAVPALQPHSLQVLLAWVHAHGTGSDDNAAEVALMPLSYYMGLVATECLEATSPTKLPPQSPPIPSEEAASAPVDATASATSTSTLTAAATAAPNVPVADAVSVRFTMDPTVMVEEAHWGVSLFTYLHRFCGAGGAQLEELFRLHSQVRRGASHHRTP